jgi:Leucine-rich repeat (LRR) protein
MVDAEIQNKLKDFLEQFNIDQLHQLAREFKRPLSNNKNMQIMNFFIDVEEKYFDVPQQILRDISIRLPFPDVYNMCDISASMSEKCSEFLTDIDYLVERAVNENFSSKNIDKLKTSKNPLMDYVKMYATHVDGIEFYYTNTLTPGVKILEMNYTDIPNYVYEAFNDDSIRILKLNNLQNLSPKIGLLKKLRNLNIVSDEKSRGLTVLPPEIGGLENLVELNLENNSLTVLPKEIGNLKKLKHLELEGNKLKSVPRELGKIKTLDYLGLYGNDDLIRLPEELERFE